MNRISRAGHLVKIRNKATQREEYLFLYITGAEPPGAYKAVIKGIRDLRLPSFFEEKAELRADAVEDFSLVEQDLSRTIDYRIYRIPITAFYDQGEKMFKESLFLGGVVNVIEKDGDFFPANPLTAVATGSDFFDRERVIARIWKHLSRKESIYLYGPRRFGKTSILKRIEGMASLHRFRPVMIDLEGVAGPEEFVDRLASEIEGPVRTPCLFILDEWPYMLDTFLCKEEGGHDGSQDKTADFVKWFREVRASLQGHDVFLFSGSINLRVHIKDNNLGREYFSDLKEMKIDYFDRTAIRDYLESLLLGREIILSDRVYQHLAQMAMPGIPYFIQILENMVVSLFQKNPGFSIQALQEAYEKITGLEGRRYFDTFERHFKCYGNRKPGAKAVLKALARAGEKGLEKEDLHRIYGSSFPPSIVSGKEFDLILSYLEYDFYIEKVKETGSFRFASPLLRDYWRKNQ